MALLLHNVPLTHPRLAETDWGDGHDAHRAVMALFGSVDAPPSQARQAAAVLFRVEDHAVAPDGSAGRILVQADRQLDLADGTVRSTDLAAHLDAFHDRQQVQLLLRANTVRTINRTHDGAVRQHRARVPDADLPAWLARKLDRAVTLGTVALVGDDDVERDVPAVKSVPCDIRFGHRGRREAQLIRNDLYATGTVTDAEHLRRLCRDGVGRAKAYGCGMLTVVPG